MNLNSQLSDSARDFLNVVWPKIKELSWLDGELAPVEATTIKEWANKLDTLSGIDAWYIKKNSGLSGIASRVQWKPEQSQKYPYNTFNIRYKKPSGAKTEYQKRIEAINSDGELLYPYWTCHAYLCDKEFGPILSMALARTVDVIEACSLGIGFERINPTDGTTFINVPWRKLHNEGYQFYAFPSSITAQLRLLEVSRV